MADKNQKNKDYSNLIIEIMKEDFDLYFKRAQKKSKKKLNKKQAKIDFYNGITSGKIRPLGNFDKAEEYASLLGSKEMIKFAEEYSVKDKKNFDTWSNNKNNKDYNSSLTKIAYFVRALKSSSEKNQAKFKTLCSNIEKKTGITLSLNSKNEKINNIINEVHEISEKKDDEADKAETEIIKNFLEEESIKKKAESIRQKLNSIFYSVLGNKVKNNNKEEITNPVEDKEEVNKAEAVKKFLADEDNKKKKAESIRQKLDSIFNATLEDQNKKEKNLHIDSDKVKEALKKFNDINKDAEKSEEPILKEPEQDIDNPPPPENKPNEPEYDTSEMPGERKVRKVNGEKGVSLLNKNTPILNEESKVVGYEYKSTIRKMQKVQASDGPLKNIPVDIFDQNISIRSDMGTTLLQVKDSKNQNVLLTLEDGVADNDMLLLDEHAITPEMKEHLKALAGNGVEIISSTTPSGETHLQFRIPISHVQVTKTGIVRYEMEGNNFSVEVDGKNIITRAGDEIPPSVISAPKNQGFNIDENTRFSERLLNTENKKYEFVSNDRLLTTILNANADRIISLALINNQRDENGNIVYNIENGPSVCIAEFTDANGKDKNSVIALSYKGRNYVYGKMDSSGGAPGFLPLKSIGLVGEKTENDKVDANIVFNISGNKTPLGISTTLSDSLEGDANGSANNTLNNSKAFKGLCNLYANTDKNFFNTSANTSPSGNVLGMDYYGKDSVRMAGLRTESNHKMIIDEHAPERTSEENNKKDGRDNKDGRDGRDGRDGKDGKDGKDGRDGIVTGGGMSKLSLILFLIGAILCAAGMFFPLPVLPAVGIILCTAAVMTNHTVAVTTSDSKTLNKAVKEQIKESKNEKVNEKLRALSPEEINNLENLNEKDKEMIQEMQKRLNNGETLSKNEQKFLKASLELAGVLPTKKHKKEKESKKENYEPDPEYIDTINTKNVEDYVPTENLSNEIDSRLFEEPEDGIDFESSQNKKRAKNKSKKTSSSGKGNKGPDRTI